MTPTPRWVSAQASTPYRIGLLLPSTGTGANDMAECIRGMPVLAADIILRGGLLGKHPIENIILSRLPDETGRRRPRGEATDPQ